jgi:hypothetical protein
MTLIANIAGPLPVSREPLVPRVCGVEGGRRSWGHMRPALVRALHELRHRFADPPAPRGVKEEHEMESAT